MENYQVEMALIRYIRSYPNFESLPQEEQWKIAIEKRKELVGVAKEGKTIHYTPQDLHV
ncbi:hypothetical protein [Lysinibacillus sphaericus]|uniref:hypothetical protein n=1 Tax=Lysinibacillus sphaericus TaxID=1421 RepID=UPI0018CEC418|nr:hypothetical protein [Lysinibacillus sphaericus]